MPSPGAEIWSSVLSLQGLVGWPGGRSWVLDHTKEWGPQTSASKHGHNTCRQKHALSVQQNRCTHRNQRQHEDHNDTKAPKCQLFCYRRLVLQMYMSLCRLTSHQLWVSGPGSGSSSGWWNPNQPEGQEPEPELCLVTPCWQQCRHLQAASTDRRDLDAAPQLWRAQKQSGWMKQNQRNLQCDSEMRWIKDKATFHVRIYTLNNAESLPEEVLYGLLNEVYGSSISAVFH